MRELFSQLGTAGAVVVIGLLILSLTFHEAAHAFVANRLGDPTAKRLGRLTLNPLPHIDPVMTILLPAILLFTTGFIFGGAKPVPVDPRQFRSPHRDNAIVALAGPLSNVILAMAALAALHACEVTGAFDGKLLRPILHAFAAFNILLAVFNALPIPPLDGSRVVSWLLPGKMRMTYGSIERYGILVLILLVLFVEPFQVALSMLLNSVGDALQWLVTFGGAW